MVKFIVHIWRLLTQRYYRRLWRDLRYKPFLFNLVILKLDRISDFVGGLKVRSYDITETRIIIYIRVKQDSENMWDPLFNQLVWFEDELYIDVLREKRKQAALRLKDRE